MFLLNLLGDALASALGGLFPGRRKGRPPREPWAVRRSRKRMEAQQRKPK